MPPEGSLGVKGYSAGRAAHVNPCFMHILGMGAPAVRAKNLHF